MSGSSLDGIDMAWVEFSGDLSQLSWKLHAGETISLPLDISTAFTDPTNLTATQMAALDSRYCKWTSEALKGFIQAHSCDIQYIASHGHTLFHNPHAGYTVQLGNGGYLAGHLGIDVISDFRTTDVACGGQGAPFAPIADRYLFEEYNYLLNLGGIANITFTQDAPITAFDICPCNQILNYLANGVDQEYDRGGALARQGQINVRLLEDLNQVDFYQLTPPKSIDNGWISKTYRPILDRYSISVEDKLATTSHHIAHHIDAVVMQYGGKSGKLCVTGGGAFNTKLIEDIGESLQSKSIEIIVPEDDIVNYKEAILMAFMGYLRVMGIPNVIPSVTAATRPTISGAIYRG